MRLLAVVMVFRRCWAARLVSSFPLYRSVIRMMFVAAERIHVVVRANACKHSSADERGDSADVNSFCNLARCRCRELNHCTSRQLSDTADRYVKIIDSEQHVHGQSLAVSSLRGPLSDGCMTALTRGRSVNGAVEEEKFPIECKTKARLTTYRRSNER